MQRILHTLALLSCSVSIYAASSQTLEQITVTAQRTERVSHDTAISSIIDIAEKQPIHISETLNQAPNTWISEGGNGQENLTAIRSPSFTGAGSCSNFLMSEDGIPLRANAFCNVNQLFDSNYQQAQRLEVLRGPGSAFQGGGAVHGVINIISPPFNTENKTDLAVFYGSHDIANIALDHRYEQLMLQAIAIKDQGYKDNSGYEQQKIRTKILQESDNWTLTHSLNLMNLKQQSAGYVENHTAVEIAAGASSEDAYKDPARKKENPTPDAFRNAQSLRLSSEFRLVPRDNAELILTPYIRSNNMQFTMHYLPGEPMEDSGSNSIGLQSAYIRQANDDLQISTGFDMDYSDGYVKQKQTRALANPALPLGEHYNFDLDVTTIALFLQANQRWSAQWQSEFGIRLEHAHYDYKNKLSDGDACISGTVNCRYTRPANSKSNYQDWSPYFSTQFEYLSQQFSYIKLSQGFRAPHSGDLYRLEGGQQMADIDSEELQSLELGFNGQLATALSYQLSFFSMHKDNVIIKTNDRAQVDGQKTKHRGVEFAFSYYFAQDFLLTVASSYSKHQYDSNASLFGSSSADIRGNIIDSAPRHLHNFQLQWFATENTEFNAELAYLGSYYLNAENTFRYPGHSLLNVYYQQKLPQNWGLRLALINASDVDYADRADVTPFYGQPEIVERYFIGEPRNLRFTLTKSF